MFKKFENIFLLSILIHYGRRASAVESSIGKLEFLVREDVKAGEPPLSAILALQPGSIGSEALEAHIEILGWEKLIPWPPRFKPGTIVAVEGFRTSDRRVGGGIGTFRATSITVIGPQQSLADPGAPVGLSSVTGRKSVLIVRPRMPASCPADAVKGVGSVKEWTSLIAKVDILQHSCTGGRLGYRKPVVSGFVDIPCITSNYRDEELGCDVMAMLDQMDLARNAAKKLGSDPGSYDHVIVDLPVQEGCRLMGFGYFYSSKIGYMGYAIRTNYSSFADQKNVLAVAHEMGHNYGLTHSNALLLGKRKAPPRQWQRMYGTNDESSLMGYGGLLSCFNLPQSTMLGLASVRSFTPKALPPGKRVAFSLRTSWGPAPQGAFFQTGRRKQEDWRIWASYMVTTGSGFKDGSGSPLLPASTFNKAVQLHLTSSKYPFGIPVGVSRVHRVWIMQSGEVFNWRAAGLVFKFNGVSRDGMRANMLVCRQEGKRKCGLSTSPPSPGKPLLLTIRDQRTQYCLQACTFSTCQLPSSKRPQPSAIFTSPCPRDSSSKWQRLRHASGIQRLMNKATGKCLAIQLDEASMASNPDVGNPTAAVFRLALQPCSTNITPGLRLDPQLFQPHEDGGREGSLDLQSVHTFPNCSDCGVETMLCLRSDHGNSSYLPVRRGRTYLAAVAAACW